MVTLSARDLELLCSSGILATAVEGYSFYDLGSFDTACVAKLREHFPQRRPRLHVSVVDASGNVLSEFAFEDVGLKWAKRWSVGVIRQRLQVGQVVGLCGR